MPTQKNYTGMFTGAVSVISPNREQQKCPVTAERVNKLGYIHPVENCLAVEQTADGRNTMGEPHDAGSEGSWKKMNAYGVILFISNLRKCRLIYDNL